MTRKHQNHHPKRAAAPGEWASRNRSYVVTLGMIFAAAAVLLWRMQGGESPQWPVWKWVVLYALSALALGFAGIGLLGGQGLVKKVATYTSLSWVTFPVRLLALPVQLGLSAFDRKR